MAMACLDGFNMNTASLLIRDKDSVYFLREMRIRSLEFAGSNLEP